MTTQQEILDFWFPAGLDADLETHGKHMRWCMNGGADQEIVARFAAITHAAGAGKLDHWGDTAEGRLALIVVLDQFSRSVFRGTAAAFANDARALGLALEGLHNGHFDALKEVWKKTFFILPLGHAEGPDLLARIDRIIAIADQLHQQAPRHLAPVYEFSRNQPREQRKVVERFGRHPHRNELLGRSSTPEECAYLAAGELPHERLATF